MGKSVFEIVTDRIVSELENGTIPWKKPFTAGLARSWKYQRPYRGVNLLLVPPGEYATFKQINEAGGKVKKGASCYMVVFWKWMEVDRKASEIEKDRKEYPYTEVKTKKKIPFLRYYRVFNIETQVEGLGPQREQFDNDPIEEAEKIVAGYDGSPIVCHAPFQAYYSPKKDTIVLPQIEDHYSSEAYYATLFHEIVHSTGHPSRLDRGELKDSAYNSEQYSKEELIAELGAAMLCATCRIEQPVIENSAAYIQSWLKAFKDDKKLLVHAAAKAQKAVDYMLGVKLWRR